MILKNYKILRMANNIDTVNSGSGTISLPVSYKDTSGTSRSGAYTCAYFNKTEIGTVYTPGVPLLAKPSLEILVGTGTTAVAIDDYALESDVTSSFSNLSTSISFGNVGDTYAGEYTIFFTGRNNTNADITISEIGIVNKYIWYNGNDTCPVLLLRQLLETPLTVGANETFHFTLVWTEN